VLLLEGVDLVFSLFGDDLTLGDLFDELLVFFLDSGDALYFGDVLTLHD
jgi:hypothetical protein